MASLSGAAGWEDAVAATLALFVEKEAEQTWGAFAADLQGWADRVTAAGSSGIDDAERAALAQALLRIMAPVTQSVRRHADAPTDPHTNAGPSLCVYVRLCVCMCTQMLSLRSALSTTTCALVAAAATTLGRALEPLADPLLTALLELAGRSNRIFVRAAETALRAIADHGHVRAPVPWRLCHSLCLLRLFGRRGIRAE
jgi:hypothetical protein